MAAHTEDWLKASAVDLAIYNKRASAGLLVPIALGRSIPLIVTLYHHQGDQARRMGRLLRLVLMS
ncbi:hypothetical protein EJ02DRAFT_460926 [Clathrospora elynae]|uniref:Uncharacterized protein n=1 Tax=Clathrospora elynae TaxID=706981 RepID=A0A6A5S3Q4_9PLEO|nr:hypothetical protein EJ02DRAFT_460926 [Clathrospora elynae]